MQDPDFPIDAIRLVVVDEAHKAKGNYAYCGVIKAIKAVNSKFRVVALSATPGKQVDVIEIIQNLLIAKIETRTENSPDVRNYVYEKKIEIERIPLGEIEVYSKRFANIIDPYLRKLMEYKVIDGRNSNKGWIILQQKKFFVQPNVPNRAEITKTFSVVISLLYSQDLLERHGIQIFLKSFNDEKNSKTSLKYFVGQDRDLQTFINELKEKFQSRSPFLLNVNPLPNGEVPSIIDKDVFYGHPKFDILRAKLVEYFTNGGTKTIIFCEFRDTVLLVYTMLLQLRPTVLPRMLIGQGGAVSQKDQLNVMKDFRSNKVNVLITTSVCEEGIDVGEVDLVICFDVNSKNSTRFVQRIGRTGRKRDGKVLLLATEGREQENIIEVVESKDRVNKSLSTNKEIFNSLYRGSPRLVPVSFCPKMIETKFNIPTQEEVVKAKKARKTTKKELAAASTKSIASHFQTKPLGKRVQCDQLGDTQQDCDLSFEPQETVEPETAAPLIVEAVKVKQGPDELTENFQKEFSTILKKIDKKPHLMELLKANDEHGMMMMKNFISLFNNEEEVTNSINFSIDNVLEITHFDDKLPAAESTKNHIESPKSDHKQQIPFASPEFEFMEVESRYGNQFSIPEPFNTPFKSSPFLPINNILNCSVKSTPPQLGPPSNKRTHSGKKKAPMENIIKAFEKQRNMSTSTPISSRASASKTLHSNRLVAAPEVSKQSEHEKTVLEFFGVNSIDDIFEGLDDETTADDFEQHSMPRQSKQASPSLQDRSIAQLLEDDNELLMNISMEEEVVESSMTEEPKIPARRFSEKVEMPVEGDSYEFNLDDIFENSDTDLDKNIENCPNDSQNTEEYEVESSLIDESVKAVETPGKENILIVHSVSVEFISPKKSPPPSRPRPNFSKLLNALKTSNILSPSPQTAQLPISNTPVASKRFASERTITTPPSSTSVASPVTSRVKFALPKPSKSSSPCTLPVRRKIPRKRKRNQFLETQAGVDGTDSSDEDDGDETLDGFIANNVTCMEVDDDEVDMHAKYLISLRSPSARQRGNFKIPQLPPPPVSMSQIFSQMPEEEDDWELDSFVVDNEDVDEGNESSADELDIAERKLKEKRRHARQLKKGAKRRKVVRLDESSDEDEELEKLRKQLQSNPD